MKTQPSLQNDQDSKVKEMVMRILEEKEDWAKHIHHNCCKCQKCNCGKHLCKFQSIQLDLKPTCTTYNHDYTPKKRVNSKNFSKPTEKGKIDPITRGSTYKKDYPAKKGQYYSASQKKSNNLKIGGPSFINTTYGDSFAPYESPKKQQPIKNPNNIAMTGARMNSKSSYDNTYKWKPNSTASQYKAQKRADNLKVDSSLPFQALTSYNNFFTIGNSKNLCPKQSFAPNNVYIPIKNIPTKSSYRDNFNSKTNVMCPAALYS